MRHLREIVNIRSTQNVLAQSERQLGLAVPVGVGLENLAEVDDFALGVGHLDADGAFAGDRRHDPNGGGLQSQSEVISQRGDLADLHPRGGHHLELGDHRARGATHYAPFNLEGGEGLDQDRAQPIQRVRADRVLLLGRRCKQLERRQLSSEQLDLVQQVRLDRLALSSSLTIARTPRCRGRFRRVDHPARAGRLQARFCRRAEAPTEPIGQPATHGHQTSGDASRASQHDRSRQDPPPQGSANSARAGPRTSRAAGERPERSRPQYE